MLVQQKNVVSLLRSKFLDKTQSLLILIDLGVSANLFMGNF